MTVVSTAAASVPTVPLSHAGPVLSRVVYGTWRLFDDPSSATPQHVLRRLEACAELGITTIDTAEIYGGYEVEELLGRALALAPGLRQRLQIVSKCGIYVPNARHPDRKVAFYNASSERLRKSCDKSLRLLGTDVIDLFLVHRPDWLTPAEDTARGLDALQAEGKIRSAGVSNYTTAQLELLSARAQRPLVTNQIELSLFQMAALTDGTLDQAQRLGMRPMAWSTLGGGRLFDPQDPAGARLRAAMASLRDKYGGADETALALAWVLALPSRPVAIFATNKLERLASAAQAASLQLDRQDWYLLWEAAQGRRVP